MIAVQNSPAARASVRFWPPVCLLSVWSFAGCWNADIAATTSPGPAEVDRPAAWYRFEDPTALGRDSSGRHWDAVPVNVMAVKDPQRAGVVHFDSSALIFLPTVQRDFTVSLWIKTQQLGPDQPVWTSGARIVDADVSGVRLDFGLALTADKLAYGIGTPGDPNLDSLSLKSQRSVADGMWHHVAIVRNTSIALCQLFLDGTMDAERAAPLGDLALPKVFTLGDLGNTSPVSPPLKADLSDVRFYNHALSTAGIVYLGTQ